MVQRLILSPIIRQTTCNTDTPQLPTLLVIITVGTIKAGKAPKAGTIILYRLLYLLNTWIRDSFGWDVYGRNIASLLTMGNNFSRIYEHLNYSSCEFRLVAVLPSELAKDPILCELKRVTLQDSPDYEALSYAWGDSKQRSWIKINGYNLQITARLEMALRQLRSYSGEKRILWIDAICINQADDEERTHQVRQMREIYNRAQQVLVWLAASEYPSSGVAALVSALAGIRSVTASLEDPTVIGGLADHLLDNVFNDKNDWSGLVMMLKDPWWNRAWIVQELVFAQSVVILLGDIPIIWTAFEQCMTLLFVFTIHAFHPGLAKGFYENDDEPPGLTQRGQDLKYITSLRPSQLIELRQHMRDVKSMSLLRLLAQNWNRGATDPRDKVFALLGLATDEHSSSVVPDYSKPVDHVYRKVVQDIIERQQNLDVLSCGGLYSHGSTFPSWCPNWTSDGYRPIREAIQFIDRDERWFNSAGGTLPDFSFSADLNVLVASGFKVDTVKTIGQVQKNRHVLLLEVLSQCKEVGIVPTGDEDVYQTGEPWVEAVEQTMLFGGSDGFENLGETLTIDGSLSGPIDLKSLKGLSPSDPEDAMDNDRGPRTRHETFRRTLRRDMSMWGRLVFSTEQGFLGNASPNIREGDVVVILLGGRTPFILRKDSAHWLLVEACYSKYKEALHFYDDNLNQMPFSVHGLMQGEILRPTAMECPTLTTFEIY